MPKSPQESPRKKSAHEQLNEYERAEFDKLLKTKREVYDKRRQKIEAIPTGPEKDEAEEELYQTEGYFNHRIVDWLNGSDITFNPSDLEVNPETRTSRATDIRRSTELRRRRAAEEKGLW